MARLPPEQQKELKKSEVEWIKHRDQEGTDPGLNWLILSFKTRERIKDIRADFPLENGPYPPPGYKHNTVRIITSLIGLVGDTKCTTCDKLHKA
jgi:hypothetical protein